MMAIFLQDFDVIEWFDLNPSSDSLFETLPIKDFLDDLLMWLYILSIWIFLKYQNLFY